MSSFTKSYTGVAATTLTAANYNSNWDALTSFVNGANFDSTNIAALSITNALVSTTAAIAVSKLAAGTSTQVLLNTATPTPTWTTLSGDVTVGATGVTAIGASKVTNAMLAGSITYANLALTGGIVNADLSASAAVDFTKLAPLADGKILMGNGSNVATAVTPSGDVTMTNAGVTAVGNGKITPQKQYNDYMFRAYKAASTTLSLSATVNTKVNFATESYDYNSNYDAATNYRYTAPVTGTYQFDWTLRGAAPIGANIQTYSWLYKNGATISGGAPMTPVSGGVFGSGGSAQIELADGDYTEIYAYSSGGNQIDGDAAGSYSSFSGRLVRAA